MRPVPKYVEIIPTCFIYHIAGADGFCNTWSHTMRDTHLLGFPWTSDQPVAEAAVYTTLNKHKRRKPMPSAGFDYAILAIEVLQTHA
jgi:hypothetical protein